MNKAPHEDGGAWPDATSWTIGRRIKYALSRRPDLTYEVVGEAVGVTRAAVAQWVSAKDPTTPDSNRLQRLAEVLGCPAGWLVTGEPVSSSSSLQSEPYYRGRVRNIPVLSWSDVGRWCDANYGNLAQGTDVEPMSDVGPRSFVLPVEGPSMEPEFRVGTFIVVDPDVPWKSGDYVVAELLDSKQSTLKQVIVDAGRTWLRPLNSQFPSIEVTDNVRIRGVVVRDFRRRR